MKPTRFARAALFSLGIAALALTAGCSSSTPETPVDNGAVNNVEPGNLSELSNFASPPSVPANAAVPPAASDRNADFTKDAQTQDDADASGMTSKLPQDNGAAPAKQ